MPRKKLTPKPSDGADFLWLSDWLDTDPDLNPDGYQIIKVAKSQRSNGYMLVIHAEPQNVSIFVDDQNQWYKVIADKLDHWIKQSIPGFITFDETWFGNWEIEEDNDLTCPWTRVRGGWACQPVTGVEKESS